jgi:riboflavin kinase/FMN adenylyltransferase
VELIRELGQIDPRYKGGVVSVGVFDGVHVGHRRVLGRTVERARALGAPAVAFTFHPHPLAVLRPEEAPPLIQTFGQKLEFMREIGIAAVIWPREGAAVLAMPPQVFFHEVVCGALAARAMVEGGDFRFGSGAGGDRRTLESLAGPRGIEVEFVGEVLVDGERVSSTRIRRLIAAGGVAEAARCLGRPYRFQGTVVEGEHRGAKLGYPTINVESPRFLVPAEGVYAGRALVLGKSCAAAISIGRMPTFHAAHPLVVEAFLLDFEGELYGEQAALDFLEYLRPQQAFPDAEALKRQMAADCERVRGIVGKGTYLP